MVSEPAKINASIIQGSGLGPVAFVLNNSDLAPHHAGNTMSKYADDSYLIVPSSNTKTIPSELSHIEKWAGDHNLLLNSKKTKEMVVYRQGGNWRKVVLPPVFPGIERVDQIKVLGVTLTSALRFDSHISNVLKQTTQSSYALKILKAHGLSGAPLWDITRATVVARLLYASPVWWGYADAADKIRLQASIRRLVKRNFLPPDFLTFNNLCEGIDKKFFTDIHKNKTHVLNHLLPPKKEICYDLRPGKHDREIDKCSTSMRKNFIPRMVLHDCSKLN
jgi:hypothetical protein